MKSFKNITILALLVFGMSACEKSFEDLQVNPNQPASAPPSLIFQGVLNDMAESCWNDNIVMRYSQFHLCNYNYYGNNEYNWTTSGFDFYTLNNVKLMETEAEKLAGSTSNPYSALGKFFKAYFSVRMSLKFGDVPFSQALQGLDNTTPVYDTQKEVFAAALNLLEEANDLMAAAIGKNDNSLQGDIYLGNDLVKWQKVINTYKLRLLIHLSKHADDSDLNVKGRFADVLNNPSQFPIMEGLGDNMAYIYNSSTNTYPTNPGNSGFDAGRYNHSDTYLGLLVSLKDPRTFVVADPAPAKLAQGLTENDFEAYVGAPAGEGLDDMTFKMGNGEYSAIDQERYYSTFSGPEPCIQIGYAELCFNIAEAINRGWVSGDAGEWYNRGITASMNFYGITDATALAGYLAQAEVDYAGNNADGLEQILTQKYLAFFQNSGWEAFYNQRRTGVPVFHIGPGTGNGDRIPKRFQYPASERNTNTANYDEAVTRQFGDDDINGLMWLVK
ncbi:MAG: SusD/RagB family nutrient-binding outer membrane lipoprotein [Saprospiraceae bacterium]|nr:SusD/RagB family nutrient-binding outer membrane lipoprotein [Saprospiraceae bacterium]